MVTIQSSSNYANRAIDVTLILCAAFTLLVFVLLLDAYEYVAVPGASHARNKLHTNIEDVTGMEIMTREEHDALKQEIEEAKRLVEKKHAELQKIMRNAEKEEVKLSAATELEKDAVQADEAREVETSSSSSSSIAETPTTSERSIDTHQSTKDEETKQVEENEEIIEAILEEELGIKNFCDECKWQQTNFSCLERVSFLMSRYHLTEVVAKESTLKDCTKGGRQRLLRGV
jgi:hypothetical protein